MNRQTAELEPHLSQLDICQLEALYASLSDYSSNPVHIEEFLDSDKYLGPYFGGGLYPYWRQVLKDIYPSPFYSPYWLVALRGCIGQGKSSIACAGIAYDLYKLLVMNNPQDSFNLLQSTKIIFAIFNRTLTLSSDVIWDKLSQMFVQSPFFYQFLGALGTKKRKNDTMFPKRIDFVLGSRMGHSLGAAVHSAVISEANFEVVEGQTYEVFNSVLRRMESRFMNPGGGVAGKIWVDSSETDKFSAVNKIIDSYRKSTNVYVSQAALWEVKSHLYGSDRFWVYKGSDHRQPSILENNDKTIINEASNCIQVPVEHRDAFEADVHEALRDLGGVSTTSSYKLFRLKEKLNAAIVVSPMFPDEITLDFDDESDQIWNHCLVKSYFANPLNKNFPRYIHVDIGVSGDRLGIAASYVSKFKERYTQDVATQEKIAEIVPETVTEWCVGINPTPGKQIPLFKVNNFIQWMSQQGYLLGKISFDGYQSTFSMQALIKNGFDAELFSMDKTSLPYIDFRNSVYEGRTMLPINAIFKRECEELEISSNGEKVDHPKKSVNGGAGSKDISDAVGGSVVMAMKESNKVKMLHLVEARAYQSKANAAVSNLFWPS